MGFLDRLRSSDDDPDDDPGAVPEDSLAEQRAAMEQVLVGHGLSPVSVAAVLEHARDGVGLAEGGATDRCRLSGRPELPPGESWPTSQTGTPFTFIGRLDLAALPQLAPLPTAGVLLLYWDERFAEHDPMDFRAATRVFWVPEGQTPVPVGSPDDAASAIGLTGRLMPILGELECVQVPDDEADALYDAADEITQAGPSHQLLGASRDIQGPVLDEVGYWFEQGAPASREGYTAAEVAGEGWLLLAQIDETGPFGFGDLGAVYFVMPAVDLAVPRFDRVVGIMQCS